MKIDNFLPRFNRIVLMVGFFSLLAVSADVILVGAYKDDLNTPSTASPVQLADPLDTANKPESQSSLVSYRSTLRSIRPDG